MCKACLLYTSIRKENLGGSQVCFEALKKGEIDMYVDYTGTIYVNILNQPAKADMQAFYDECKKALDEKYKIKVLEPVSYTHLDVYKRQE